MYKADALAIASGVSGLTLMEAAGTAIARAIRLRWRPRPVVVLCGPGNNGGDGFVVARLLASEGWPVRLGLLGAPEKLRGDAAENRDRWNGAIHDLDVALLDREPLVVDALFGAGLTRAIDGRPSEIISAINERCLPCVGVDVPSGVHGDKGEVLGVAPRCQATVTFFRAKPGHFLMPGRDVCGELIVADIGIPEAVLDSVQPRVAVNGPEIWSERFPWPGHAGNKYTRGHAVVVGGREMTGAARLAASAARRIGAGLVTIAAHPDAHAIYSSDTPGTIVARVKNDSDFADLMEDRRHTCALIGPGAGVDKQTQHRVLTILATGKPCVLDADALTVFKDAPERLFSAIKGPCLLTPHEGEFSRLFASQGDKLTRAVDAARTSGASMLLKGTDTVIASPDGRAVINQGAPPELATAGAGDVLTGMAVGLMGQGLNAFDAGCAAVWLHGRIAADFGAGLIAEDLVAGIPLALSRLKQSGAVS
ncbi:MAG: NAD(P)H-hydrate dehydratase [Hyphomicrobiales bacterium]|nr:NAD(P)H-hydrate dehydratase [Hyphomicrobiales bacterium]